MIVTHCAAEPTSWPTTRFMYMLAGVMISPPQNLERPTPAQDKQDERDQLRRRDDVLADDQVHVHAHRRHDQPDEHRPDHRLDDDPLLPMIRRRHQLAELLQLRVLARRRT